MNRGKKFQVDSCPAWEDYDLVNDIMVQSESGWNASFPVTGIELKPELRENRPCPMNMCLADPAEGMLP